MATFDEFKEITTDYDNRLFEVFRRIIDTAIQASITNEMNALDRFVYVNNCVEKAYRELACAQGIIATPNLPYNVTPPISDELMERIYDYTDPLVQEARNYLQAEVDKIVDSSTLGELMEKYEAFKAMLEEKEVDSFLYEDLDIKKGVK